MSDKKCESIEHPNLMKGGWGCCSCSTYNGGHREECKFCAHARCFFPAVVVENTVGIEKLDAFLDKEFPDITPTDTGALIKKKLLN